MQKLMAFYTQRNDVEPVVLFIALMVMILLCGNFLAFITLKTRRSWEFSANNSIVNSIFCLSFVFVVMAVFSVALFPGSTFRKVLIVLFAFCAVAKFGFPLSFQVFAVFAVGMTFVIFLVAFSAISLEAKGSRRILIECRKRFFGLASRASFCYSELRHGFFLVKKLCLEPLQAQYLCGSIYYPTFPQEYNQKLRNK